MIIKSWCLSRSEICQHHQHRNLLTFLCNLYVKMLDHTKKYSKIKVNKTVIFLSLGLGTSGARKI